jgi:hypothetical protein
MYHRGLETIADRLQEKLVDSEYLVHCFDSKITTLISCKLAFESGRQLVIRNGADAESLIVEEREPEEMDLGEYGLTKRISADAYDPAQSRSCVGRRFDRCRLLIGSDDQIRAIGLGFEGRDIAFRNLGDNLIAGGAIVAADASGSTRVVEIP